MAQVDTPELEWPKLIDTQLNTNSQTFWRPATPHDLDFVIKIYNDLTLEKRTRC